MGDLRGHPPGSPSRHGGPARLSRPRTDRLEGPPALRPAPLLATVPPPSARRRAHLAVAPRRGALPATPRRDASRRGGGAVGALQPVRAREPDRPGHLRLPLRVPARRSPGRPRRHRRMVGHASPVRGRIRPLGRRAGRRGRDGGPGDPGRHRRRRPAARAPGGARQPVGRPGRRPPSARPRAARDRVTVVDGATGGPPGQPDRGSWRGSRPRCTRSRPRSTGCGRRRVGG